MATLRPCTGCQRHVRADETRCPFCEAALSVFTPSPLVSEARLGRAARMALGAAMATASLAGCGHSSSGGDSAVPVAAESARAATATPTSAPTTQAAVATPPSVSNPFLVTGATADTGNAAAAPPPTATTTAPPKVIATTRPKLVVPTATAVRDPNWGNHAKPYGAPPADGLLQVV